MNSQPASRTKIVVTLGPATDRKETLRNLIEAGADVFRFNFAHGTHAEHARRIKDVRLIAAGLRRPVGLLQDLPGPKIRVGKLLSQGRVLRENDEVLLTGRAAATRSNEISITYPRLTSDLKPDQPVYIADGSIRLVALHREKDGVRCRVAVAGTVRAGNGVNMPLSPLRLKAFTKEDQRHLAFGLSWGVDFVGISFVGEAADIEHARDFAKRRGQHPYFVAKIERRRALDNLAPIVSAADAIMVARGDLGVEVPFSEIPGYQTDILQRSQMEGKPVIVATQVMESMLENPRPTRAEATDVAHAVMSGTDAIMLSGETSIGRYPVEAVRALTEIIDASERRWWLPVPAMKAGNGDVSWLVAESACQIADEIGTRYLVVTTRTGASAIRTSRFRPRARVLVLASDERVRRRLTLVRGVETVRLLRGRTLEETIRRVKSLLLKQGRVKKNERVVLSSAGPGTPPGETALIQVLRI